MHLKTIMFGIACLLGMCWNVCDGLHTLIAPQVIREGVEETIILNLHDYDEESVDVTATVKGLGDVESFNFLNQDTKKPIPLKVKHQPGQGQEEGKLIDVLVTVKNSTQKLFDNSIKMKFVDERGYLYVQTDRPIYRPKEKVRVRVSALSQTHCPEINRKVETVIRVPTNNVAVDRQEHIMTEGEFITTDFDLPEYPVFGIWSIQTRFVDEKIAKWSETKFEVRKYVLPTFNVKLTLDKPYILVKNNQNMSNDYIEGTITAKYSYGRSVRGSYFLVAKLNRPDRGSEIFHQIPKEFSKTASFIGGQQRIRIKTLDILSINGTSMEELLAEEATVTIDVSVTNYAEGTIEVDSSPPVPFVKSPYEIDISRMSKYYIPGTIFEIKVDVVDSASKKPVKNVEVVVAKENGEELARKDTDDNGRVNVKINMDAEGNNKTYKIFTRDPNVPDANEAVKQIKLNAYASKSRLQLSAAGKIAKVGNENFEIDASYNNNPKEIRYQIFARGSIVSSGVHIPLPKSTETNFKINITADLVPSFRVFGYYINSTEIVSNSLWVDVQDTCKMELSVTVVPEKVQPGEQFQVNYEAKGSPNAILGLSAVDRAAYFLYGESRLTREKLFKSFERYDDGCVREGGKNARDVFEEGGLQLVGGEYGPRSFFDISCNEDNKKRKRREIEKTVEVNLDENARLSECRLDGMITNLADQECVKRANKVRSNFERQDKVFADKCAQVFQESCISATRTRSVARGSGRSTSRNAEGLKKFSSSPRSNFEETMLWTKAILDSKGQHNQTVVAKDSITTFEFDTVALHNCDGFCVAPTKNVEIFKSVFIQLKTPYSIKRLEQVELRATVFNYGDEAIETTMYVEMGKDICSHFPEGKFTKIQTLYLSSQSAKTASFSLLPLRVPSEKYIFIELYVEDKNKNRLDWIRKSILVEPEGTIKEVKGTKAIDLKKKRREDFEIELEFPEKFLPNSRQCWLYPYFNLMGPNIEFDPFTHQPTNDVSKLITKPSGCGEQTMASVGPNVFIHKYLLSIGRMGVGSPEEKGSIDKMKTGFTNQLTHISTTHETWSRFSWETPSVWLNAYVNKVFAQAKKYYTPMDVTPICQSITWLVEQQASGGSFVKGKIWKTTMHGAVATELSVTAYVLISFKESASLCPDQVLATEAAMNKAKQYLISNENSAELNQPYTLSLTTYAMVIADSENSFTKRLLTKLKGLVNETNRLAYWKGAPLSDILGTNTHAHWYRKRPLAIDVEATGHALLAIIYNNTSEVAPETFELTRKIALWLIEQRDHNGGFSTTQDTVVGLQALSEYMIWSHMVDPISNEDDLKIDLTISSPEGTNWFDTKAKRIHLNQTNENSTTRISIPANVINQRKMTIKAEGEGSGTLSYRCVYRTLVEEDSCHFELYVNISLVDNDSEDPELKVKLHIRKPVGEPAGQSIVEVNLISGYTAVEKTLEDIRKTSVVDGIIEQYELPDQKVILYLDEITDKPIITAFHIKRSVVVDNPEPASVTVYDYYEPSIKCTKFYGLPGDIPKLRFIDCRGKGDNDPMCKCAEGGCMKCRTRQEQLTKTTCVSDFGEKCNICENGDSSCYNLLRAAFLSNYVYVINVITEEVDESGVFVEFEAKIVNVIKRGNDVSADKNLIRKITTRKDCFRKCAEQDTKSGKMKPIIAFNRTLLVMGGEDSENRILKGGDSEVTHRLDKNTIIERVIPDAKCKEVTDKLKKKCKNGKQSPSCNNRRIIVRFCKNFEKFKLESGWHDQDRK